MAVLPSEVRLAEKELLALFSQPPAELADLDAWLATWLDGKRSMPLREVILDWLGKDGIPPERHALCAYLLWRLGLGPAALRLAEIALDQRLSFPSRSVALSVLSEHDPDEAATVLESLDPHDHLRLLTAPVDDMLNAAIETGERDCVRRMLADLPPEARASLYDRTEARRQERGLPAHRLYALCLGSADLGPLCKKMLDRIWEEDPMAALTELERHAESPDSDVRARAARAQMRLRSAVLAKHGRVVQPRGWGYVTGCDGIGDYLLFVCLADERGLSVFDVMARASGEIREADRTSGVADPEVEHVVIEQSPAAFAPLLRVPLEAALALIAELEPGNHGATALEPLGSILARLGKRHGYELPAIDPETNPDELGRLLRTRPFQTWRLSPGDVLIHGVEVPQRMSRRAFVRQLQETIARPPLQRRLSSMARHMSRVHLWRGDIPAARVLEGAARECERDLARASLFLQLADRLFDEISGRRPRERMQVGSPAVRAALRSSLLATVDRPTKRDLMRLDLVEVACAALDEALDLVPRDRRPRDAELLDLVNTIGTRFVEHVLDGSSPAPLTALLAGQLQALSSIDPYHAQQLATLVLDRLERFTKTVCSRCAVGCMARPKTPCSARFHADRHPAADILS